MLDGKHVARPRPDRAQPEGRPGRLAPARSPRDRDRAAPTRSSAGGADLLPRLRPARWPPTRATSTRADPDAHDRRRVDQPGADRRDGHRHRRALPRARARADRAIDRVTRAGRERLPRRARRSPRRCSATTWPTNMIAARRRLPGAARCRSRAAAIEQAIALNGVAVEMNLARVPLGPRWRSPTPARGRATVERRRAGAAGARRELDAPRRAALVDRVGADGRAARACSRSACPS